MDQISPREVVSLIRPPVLRVRTGLWLLPLAYVGQERDEAARLQLEPIDIRQNLLDRLPPGTHYLSITPDKLLELIDEITQTSGWSDCVLIYNLDLLLARLAYEERRRVWQDLFFALPRRKRAILISIPETAADLLPSIEDLTQWDQEKRLAREH